MNNNDIEQPEIDPDAGPLWMQHMVNASLGSQFEGGGEPSGVFVVAWAMTKANVRPPKFAQPAAWCAFGFDIKTPEYGCVVCVGDYVGLFSHQIATTVYLMGALPNGTIGLRAFAESEITACRWPDPEDFTFTDYVEETAPCDT